MFNRKEYMKKYQQEHKETFRIATQKYRDKDRKKYNEYNNEYRKRKRKEAKENTELVIKYKIVLDKIKEYCNHKLEMLEIQKRNIMQILTPENGYLKADIEIEMQKYKDILEILGEIE